MNAPVPPGLVECVHCDYRLCVHEPRVGGAACPGRRRTFFSAKPSMVADKRFVWTPTRLPSPRVARLKLMHALVGLGTVLCAKYSEPDKWLIGPCDCLPVLGQDGRGCSEIRGALARVRARETPAATYVMPESELLERAAREFAAEDRLIAEVGR